MAKLNKTPLAIRAKRGTASQIESYTGYHLEGEFAYATDTNALYMSDGVSFNKIGPVDEATWGSITGTLSSQTDLQNALDDKEDVSNKSTDVTLGGVTPSSTLYTTEYAVATYVQNEIAQAQSGIPTFEIDMFANYKIYESDEDGTTTYVGTIKATNGNWLITKYVDNSGDITATYANESNNATQTTPTLAWTNRATLTYTAVNNLTSI